MSGRSGDCILPFQDEEGYLTSCGESEPPSPQPEHPSAPAAWFWLGLLIAIAVFEIWAVKTKHQTLSQLLKSKTGKTLKWIGLGGFFLLGWHLMFGGPL